jgi:DNA-binding response OmpR family regulator
MKLLIVEDDLNLIDTLKEFINPVLDVHFAKDLSEAMEYLKTNIPDVVLTDFHFPGGNGHDVARYARNVGCQKVILHTSDHTVRDIEGLYSDIYSKCHKKVLSLLNPMKI